MLPENLICEFWETVRQELLERHGLKEQSIPKAIATYRAALDRHQVGEMVYHRNPERIAKTIAAGWETGFPEPEKPGRKPKRATKRAKV